MASFGTEALLRTSGIREALRPVGGCAIASLERVSDARGESLSDAPPLLHVPFGIEEYGLHETV